MEYREGKQRCLELGRRAKRPMQPLGLSLKWGVGLVERKGCRETRALRLHALRVRKNSINHEHHLCCYHRLFESHSDPLRWVGHGRASYHRPRNGAQRDERTCPSWLSQRKSAWDWKTGLTEHRSSTCNSAGGSAGAHGPGGERRWESFRQDEWLVPPEKGETASTQPDTSP